MGIFSPKMAFVILKAENRKLNTKTLQKNGLNVLPNHNFFLTLFFD